MRGGQWVGVTGKPLTNVVAIGIGGSALGPAFVHTALATHPGAMQVRAGLRPRGTQYSLHVWCAWRVQGIWAVNGGAAVGGEPSAYEAVRVLSECLAAGPCAGGGRAAAGVPGQCGPSGCGDCPAR